MCGRFTLHSDKRALAELLRAIAGPTLFDLMDPASLAPRYNVAPSQPVVAVRRELEGPELVALRWGLVPHWANDPKIGSKLINARSETAAEKPSFRVPFRRHRCLIPADGFFEWLKKGRQKQPYHIRIKGGGPFALAGLWDRWTGADGEEIESCTILTTPANELVRPLHDRMPAVINPEDFSRWLDPAVTDPTAVQGLLKPYPAERMEAYPVGPAVNSAAREGPACVEPARNTGALELWREEP